MLFQCFVTSAVLIWSEHERETHLIHKDRNNKVEVRVVSVINASAVPVGAGRRLVLGLGLGRGFFDAAQGLVDAAGQRVGRRRSSAAALLSAHLTQLHSFTDLSQDVVVVVLVRIRRQNTQLGLPQVEASALQAGQNLVHRRARWGHNGLRWLEICKRVLWVVILFFNSCIIFFFYNINDYGFLQIFFNSNIYIFYKKI